MIISESILAALIGAAAATLAAIITVIFSRGPQIKVQSGTGEDLTFSNNEVDPVLVRLSEEHVSVGELSFTVANILRTHSAYITQMSPAVFDHAALKSMQNLLEYVDKSRRTVEKLENAVHLITWDAGEMADFNEADRTLLREAISGYRQMYSTLVGLNLIENYVADSQYHNVNKMIPTNFGKAVIKKLAMSKSAREAKAD